MLIKLTVRKVKKHLRYCTKISPTYPSNVRYVGMGYLLKEKGSQVNESITVTIMSPLPSQTDITKNDLLGLPEAKRYGQRCAVIFILTTRHHKR